MSLTAVELEELRARGQLVVAERDKLVNIALDEARNLSAAEMQQLVLLDQTINAFSNAIQHQAPAPSPTERPPLPPNRSDPGSDYRLVAAARFELNKERYRLVGQLLADYGKWLVATIAAAHLGGIYFIGSIEEISLLDKEPALLVLVAGLVLIFMCGLATFYNWQANTVFYARRVNPDYLVDPTAQPKDDLDHLRHIDLTYWVSILLGIASTACIPIATFLLSSAGHAAAAAANAGIG